MQGAMAMVMRGTLKRLHMRVCMCFSQAQNDKPTIFTSQLKKSATFSNGRRRYCSGYKDGSEDDEEEEDIDPEVWDEDLEGVKNLDPSYEFPSIKETKFYGFPDKKEASDAEDEEEGNTDDEDLEEFFSTDYERSPFKLAGVPYDEWANMKKQYDSLPKKKEDDDDFDEEKLRGNIPFEKWTELKRQFGMLPSDSIEELDYVEPPDRAEERRWGRDPTYNPNEAQETHYRKMPREPANEERMRYYRQELDRYLRIINQWDFTPRFFSTDPHVERVRAKLSAMKPDPDGVYRNVIDVISDIDILLYAYRVVKARKLGPGTECTSIPIDNIKMDWFYKTQKELRDGTYTFKPQKIVYVKKKSFKK